MKQDSPLWVPSEARKRDTHLWQFAEATAARHGRAPDDYAGLLDWSVRSREEFHDALWDFVDILGDKGSTVFKRGASQRDDRFFPEARLNYAENLLRNADARTAVIAWRDDGTRRVVSRAELRDLVSRIVQALQEDGIRPGDRVGGVLTNDIEALATYLATASLGAIWAACAPEFGPSSVCDRLGQVAPRLIVATSGYGYAGKRFDTMATVERLAELPSVESVIVLGKPPAGISDTKTVRTFDDWIGRFEPAPIAFERAPFDRPLAILFSSGTTGKPKCIMHGAGRLLLQHKKELMLHCDLHEGDRLFYYTTTSWMMWNWMVSALSVGATLVTYDGNPFHPEATRLFDMAQAERVDIFGTSAKYIAEIERIGLKPRQSHDLNSVRAVLSTGSPLLPGSYDHVYRDWKTDLHLASISGGTDICGCFAGGIPTLPVRRGEIQGPLLGMDLAAVDDQGRPCVGGAGDLVCRQSHLSMPVSFWGDDGEERFRAAYFERYDGLWCQGDFVEFRDGGGVVFHGRSDATLNPGGVRIGTAEIYKPLERIPEILDSVVVGQNWQGDQRVVLFVQMKDGCGLDDDLTQRIKKAIRSEATPRHVPAVVVSVPGIPRTHSGKIAELPVRDIVNGRIPSDVSSLTHPDCLSAIKDWVDSQRDLRT